MSVFVLLIVGTVTHSTEITHAETLASVVSVACHKLIESITGVISVGLVANTTLHVPVSSLITLAN